MTPRWRATKLHRDGTITYWSVYNQQWIRRAAGIPARELAAMDANERQRVIRHLGVAAEVGIRDRPEWYPG